MTALQTLTDVKVLVDNFYEKVRQDDQLADIFNDAIQDRSDYRYKYPSDSNIRTQAHQKRYIGHRDEGLEYV